MAYSTPYDYNEDSIRRLDEKFSEIEHDRFLYCIQEQQKWDIEKVNNFIAQLRTSHLYALKELDRLKYENRVPEEIVNIFERHGFIWGGRWYHYDTMHFEFRPEFLTK